MTESMFFLIAITGLGFSFILCGLSVMAYIYITQGKQAAVEFFTREF